ncbi:hypothetical protein AB0H83_44550 [Dactylosporangium sp. NPDC050688]|uniref:hypothetical protein n=1 Tax=Dactylosporangium sp. NPDC050688 TaxID=3157217 RepID=UPI0033FBB687
MNPDEFKQTFPVLHDTLHEATQTNRAPFADRHIVFVQHLHSSILSLVDAVLLGGADAGRVTVVGKSYSTRPAALDGLRHRGVRVVDPQRMTDPRRSYEVELEQHVTTVLQGLGTDAPLLVFDEGAVAAKVLTRMPGLAAQARVVEQTTRGARWIDDIEPAFPVVDVARSMAKATLEAPLVARTMAAGLRDILAELDVRPATVGLIGYGRMGGQLAGALTQDFDVLVHDQIPDRADAARADGWRVTDRDTILAGTGVVIGCTGSAVLTTADLHHLADRTVLANGASSDIEFALWEHRTPDAILRGADPHRPWANHYTLPDAHRSILVAGGFPLNFYGTGEPISPQEFQLTRALMLAGAGQAMTLQAPGLVPLDTDRQAAVAARYSRAMAGLEATSR